MILYSASYISIMSQYGFTYLLHFCYKAIVMEMSRPKVRLLILMLIIWYIQSMGVFIILSHPAVYK